MRRAQQALLTKPIPSSGEQLPVVGIGTNRFGVQSDAEAGPLREVLRMFPELGGRVIDTARNYGTAEEVIGRAVRAIGNRDRLFIATKYGAPPGSTVRGVAAALEAAFVRLRTDTIDLMMVHDLAGYLAATARDA